MNDFDKLKTIDISDISQKTHISFTELRLLLDKEYDAFSRTKALGFIKIIEREYSLDLKDIEAEFEAHYQTQESKGNEIFLVAPEQKNSIGRWITISMILIAGILGATFVQYYKEISSAAQAVPTLELPLVNEAQTVMIDSTNGEILSPDLNDSEPIAPSVEKIPFFVESAVNLWIGIYYLDTESNEQMFVKGRRELDPERAQIITFGHGAFKLVYGEKTIEPKNNFVQRFRFDNGEVTRLPLPPPADRTRIQNAQEGE
ncbi:MAG: hypothetical protein LBN32_02115 [Helicobacteraceae bacterium]|jgi:hypothetical protein|nr:hypothetical protein [Helicobacteraceae bacterium]